MSVAPELFRPSLFWSHQGRNAVFLAKMSVLKIASRNNFALHWRKRPRPVWHSRDRESREHIWNNIVTEPLCQWHPTSACLTPPKKAPWYSLSTRQFPSTHGTCVYGMPSSCWSPPICPQSNMFEVSSDIDLEPMLIYRILRDSGPTCHRRGYVVSAVWLPSAPYHYM